MKSKPPPPTGQLPRRERLALSAEIAWLHANGYSDYQLAKTCNVSPGAVNKARLHAQVGRRVALAMYVAFGVTPEMLVERHKLPATPGCMACEGRRIERSQLTELATLRLCPEHTLAAAKNLYG